MSNPEYKLKVSGITSNAGWIAIALLFIFFYGKPDLQDAIICNLVTDWCADISPNLSLKDIALGKK